MKDSLWSRRSVIVFFAVGFGVPWLGWTVLALSGLDRSTGLATSLFYTGDFMTVAGFVATFVAAGWIGCRSLLRRCFQVSAPVGWVFFALFVPLTWEVVPRLIYGLSSEGIGRFDLAGLTLYLSPPLLLSLTTGPLGEEAGWRGFLQPRMAGRYSPLKLSLALGVIWSLWHIPLYWNTVFASPALTVRFTIMTVCASVLMTVLWGFTRASVFWAIIFHWTLNVSGRVASGLLPDVQVPDGAVGWWESAVMIMVTVVTVAWVGMERLSQAVDDAMATLGDECIEADTGHPTSAAGG